MKKTSTLPGFTDTLETTKLIRDLSMQVHDAIRAMQDDLDTQIAENTAKTEAYLNSPSIRPKFAYKEHAKGRWSITLGNEIYTICRVDPLPIDIDEPAFVWLTPTNVVMPATSMFRGLIAIFEHYLQPAYVATPTTNVEMDTK